MIFFDIETTGLNKRKHQLHGIAILTKGIKTYYSYGELKNEHLKEILQNNEPKVGHGIYDFDIPFLRHHGFVINGPLVDTRHMAYLIDENQSTGLKELTERFFGVGFLSNKKELDRVLQELDLKHVGQLAALDIADPLHPHNDLIAEYAIEDVENSETLYHELKQRMDDLDAKVKRIFPGQKTPKDLFLEETIPFELEKMKMQERGLIISPERVKIAREQLEKEIAELELLTTHECSEFQEMVVSEFSRITMEKLISKLKPSAKTFERTKQRIIDSPKRWLQTWSWTKASQVQQLLLAMDIPGEAFLRTDNGGLSLDKEGIIHLLEQLPENHAARQTVQLYAKYKKLLKLMSTYIGDEEGGGYFDLVDKTTGRIYTSYGSFLVTGRLSSSQPNMQNLPRKGLVRGLFVPPQGKLFAHFDGSQIELRIAAHISKVETLINAYREGQDLHKLTAEMAYGDIDWNSVLNAAENKEKRQIGKTSNFLMIFDGGPKRLQQQLKEQAGILISEDEAKAFKAAFFEAHPDYRKYLNKQLEQVRRTRVVFTETGRMRRLPDIDFGNHINYKTRQLEDLPSAMYTELVTWTKVNKIQKPGMTHQEALFMAASLRYSHAKKQAYNFPVQGLGGSLIKRGIISLGRSGYEVVTTVHDSVDVLVDELTAHLEMPKIEKILTNSYKLSVPFVWEGKLLRSLSEDDEVLFNNNGVTL